MSMGNIESYHQIVPEKTVIKVVGKDLVNKWHKALEKLTKDPEICDSAVYDELMDEGYGTIDPDSKEWIDFAKATKDIKDKFKKETKMDLFPLYTDGDGDCYDDLEADKWFWDLDTEDVWERKITPAADKFLKKYGNSAIDTDARFSRYG